TIRRLVPRPGGTNDIPSSVDTWLDGRAREGAVTRSAVDDVLAAARAAAAEEGGGVDLAQETYGADVHFDHRLADRPAGTPRGGPSTTSSRLRALRPRRRGAASMWPRTPTARTSTATPGWPTGCPVRWAARRSWRPGPATTPASSPQTCPPLCCTCAIRPGY